VPALVELFTSEGCSSCPPADALLARLADEPAVAALSLHVDYWDGLGWRDPWSARFATERQRAYARRLGERSLYTPQMIVDGTDAFVGSDARRARDALARAARAPKASLAPDGDALIVRDLPIPRAEAWHARVRREATTRVERGENAGATLRHVAIAEALTPLGTVAEGARLDPPGPGLVVLQEPGPGRVVGLARL